VAIANPARGIAAEARHHADAGTDQRGADRQAEMPEDIENAIDNLTQVVARGLAANLRDRAALDPQRDHLGDREYAEDGGDHIHPVPQEQHVEGIPLGAGMRVQRHEGQHQAEHADQQALAQAFARQRGDESNTENRQQEEFRRAEGQDHGAQQRQHEGEENRADDATEARGAQAGPQRAPGLALFGHGETVDDGGRIRAGSRHAEQNAGDRPAGMDHGMHRHQEHGAGQRIHPKDEGNKQDDAQLAAKPGDRPEKHPDGHRQDNQSHQGGRPDDGQQGRQNLFDLHDELLSV